MSLRQPLVVEQGAAILARVREHQRRGKTVGLVPTMGALHRGHLSLVEASLGRCDETIVTIFVNPTQFGPGEDYSRYPRTLDSDLALLAPLGVDAVLVPAAEAMFRPEHATYVEPDGIAIPWEGEQRPGHFRGVATIVLKLIHLAPADVAFFGRKDYQQARVIEQMVGDLNVPIEIHLCPTVRDADGLALSSRNVYLSPDERRRALGLARALAAAAHRYAEGERSARAVRATIDGELAAAEVDQVQYVALCDPGSLREVDPLQGDSIALLAARVGSTHLIDNHVLGEPWPQSGFPI